MRNLFLALTVSAMFACLTAADDKGNKDNHLKGCLSKSADGTFQLTEQSGAVMTVLGSTDLEKHSANHTVILHGTRKTEAGKTTFQVERVEHVSNSCDVKPSR
jgi:hypothetical protein